MAYIGHNASGNFTTKPSKDTFSGDGSTTAFTLSEGATTNTVDVFVENVRQEPTTAYTVDGTTLTFTAAPGSGTNNIYVVNRGPLQLSATHPAAQALEASTGTFTGDLTVDTSTLHVDSTNNNVGIGTASPTGATTTTLHINGTTNAGIHITDSASGATDSDGVYLSMDSPNLYFQNKEAGFTAFETSGTERMRILAGGGLTFNGDTAAANALDDYEEGTFTPVFDQSGTAISGVTTSINTGKYTKIGNLVTVEIYLKTTAAGSPNATAQLTVGDLPFIAANVSNVFPSVSIGYKANFVTAHPTHGLVQTGQDYVLLYTIASADARNGSSTLIGSYLGNDTYLILTATYITS